MVRALKLAIGVVCCYLATSFILQTKDDIRFVIPYVEFAKETKGNRPVVLDTSVIVDGRIADVVNTRIIESEIIVPRFVLQELQTIADSADKLKRGRGRRGLDMLNRLQGNDRVEIRILDTVPEEGQCQSEKPPAPCHVSNAQSGIRESLTGEDGPHQNRGEQRAERAEDGEGDIPLC